jgi:hypothetical protein
MGKPASCSTLSSRGTLKGVRDRAILATLLYHGMRREELCGFRLQASREQAHQHSLRPVGNRSRSACARAIGHPGAATRALRQQLSGTRRLSPRRPLRISSLQAHVRAPSIASQNGPVVRKNCLECRQYFTHGALPRVRSVPERRTIVRWLSYSSGRRCEVASSSTQSSSV